MIARGRELALLLLTRRRMIGALAPQMANGLELPRVVSNSQGGGHWDGADGCTGDDAV